MLQDRSIPPRSQPKLVLASGSPRRRALLAMSGIEFEVAAPDVDEEPLAGESPAEMVARLSADKAITVAVGAPLDACILACDTIVVLDGRILGKPGDAADATTMLLSLSGRPHKVLTGWAIRPPVEADLEQGIAESVVTMRAISRAEAAAYAASGEPLDKAGSYALQGDGAKFVESVRGSRSNVIGLPLEEVIPALRRLGVAGRR